MGVCLIVISGFGAATPLAIGLSAIFRAKREDIPAVVRALRGKRDDNEPNSRQLRCSERREAVTPSAEFLTENAR